MKEIQNKQQIIAASAVARAQAVLDNDGYFHDKNGRKGRKKPEKLVKEEEIVTVDEPDVPPPVETYSLLNTTRLLEGLGQQVKNDPQFTALSVYLCGNSSLYKWEPFCYPAGRKPDVPLLKAWMAPVLR